MVSTFGVKTENFMNKKEISEKAALLMSGQLVEVDGNWFTAHKISTKVPAMACNFCDADCLCGLDLGEICSELDATTKSIWFLQLAKYRHRIGMKEWLKK